MIHMHMHMYMYMYTYMYMYMYVHIHICIYGYIYVCIDSLRCHTQDAEAFNDFGLLRGPSVMGHCVQLQKGEEELLRLGALLFQTADGRHPA